MKRTLDVRGLRCPVPVTRTGELLRTADPGEELTVVADDPFVLVDIPAFCHANHHAYLGHVEEDGVFRLTVRRGTD